MVMGEEGAQISQLEVVTTRGKNALVLVEREITVVRIGRETGRVGGEKEEVMALRYHRHYCIIII